MKIDSKLIFLLFIFTSIFFQIFILNFNFLSSNIKIPQLIFLFLLLINIKNILSIKIDRSVLFFSISSLFILFLITSFTYSNIDNEKFFNLESKNYKPLQHIFLFAFNLLSVPANYLLMKHLRIGYNIIQWFYNSVFLSSIIIALVLLLPIDSSFLFKENIEFTISGLEIKRLAGGLEFSILSVISIFCLLNDSQNKDSFILKSGKLGIFFLVILAGFSRQAFLCLIVATIIHLLHNYKFSIMNTLKYLVYTFLSFFFIIFISPNSKLLSFIFDRFLEIFSLTTYVTGTVNDRFYLWSNMLNDISANFFLGKGMDSYIKFFVYQGDGAHNLFMMILHSGGVLSLALFFYSCFELYIKISTKINYSQTHFILFLSLTILFLSSLSSLIYTIHIFWIFLSFAFYFQNKNIDSSYEKV